MSEMSSFYGGRQGSSFVIVKRFDGINIPQVEGHEYYTNRSYAVDVGNIFKLVTKAQGGNVAVDVANDVYLIGKTGANEDLYAWANHFNDGSEINSSGYHFPRKLAEGMIQCFAKGAKSASEVNYGEYVIIDTITGVNDYNNPDNGKVFRRGMNISTELAGAEYIGCIAGPKGDTVELEYDHYETIMARPDVKGYGEYDLDHNDLVPGYHIDASTGDPTYEDAIKYAYVTIKDEYNNIEGSIVGFKIPTLVEDYEAQSISPYINRAVDPSTGKYYNYDLISEDPSQYINGEWQHSFYQKWQIKVPHGYHGVNSTDFEIVPTKTMPAGFKSDDFLGATVYSNRDLDPTHEIGVLAVATDLVLTSYDATADWVEVEYNGAPAFVSKQDCYMDMLRYKETNFDNLEAGEVTYHLVGYFDTIERISLSDEGILTIYYSGDKQIETVSQPIRWIDDVEIETVASGQTDEGTGDQKIHITYNTVDGSGQKETDIVGNPLNYIIETTISMPDEQFPDVPYCHLFVYYADPALRAKYRDQWYTYASSKYPNKNWTEWVDLGPVRGVAGGIHIVKDVNSLDELKDSQGDFIPPERLKDDHDVVINPEAAGWSCSLSFWGYEAAQSTDPGALEIVADGTSPLGPNQIEISTVEALTPGVFQIGDYVTYERTAPTELLFYDYELKIWYSIGSIDFSNSKVEQIESSDSENYEILFSESTDRFTKTESARKNTRLLFNPFTGNLQATRLNGVVIGDNPKFTDTNNAVTQTKSAATNEDYRILFSNTADDDTRTEGARKDTDLTYNPFTKSFNASKINGVTQRAPLYNQELVFDNELIATISAIGITDETSVRVYFIDTEVARKAKITVETDDDTIIFTAKSAPTETVYCNVFFED